MSTEDSEQMKHTLRLTAAKTLDGVLPYTSYSINEKEFLGQFDGSLDECIAWLKESGYHYQLFAATKSLEGDMDDGSFARIPDTHPEEADGTALAELDAGECQYHVHPFERDDYIELYGHYEIHPYPWTPFWDMERPYPRHYRPTWDRDNEPRDEWTYLRGVVDSRLTEADAYNI